MQRQPSRVTALQYFIGCMMPESANALQANAAIIEMVRLSLQVHRSTHGRGLHPDLPAIAQPLIYSSSSLELLPAIAPTLSRNLVRTPTTIRDLMQLLFGFSAPTEKTTGAPIGVSLGLH